MTQETPNPKAPRRLRNLAMAGGVLVLSLAAVGAAVSSGGAARAEEPARFERVWGGGFGGHGLDRMLRSVEATPEQRKTILDAMDAAQQEIRPQVRALHEKRDQIEGLLAAETIDRAAFEQQRQELLATFDSVSKEALDAFLTAAETLTPEQRAELREKRGSGWGRGPGWWH